MRAGARGMGDRCGVEGVLTWDAGGGVTGGVNSSGVSGGARCCRHQGAAAEPTQPITIIVCGGRWSDGRGGGAGLSGERQV